MNKPIVSNERGATLIQVLTVSVIIAVLTIVAVPQVKPISQNMELSSAARKLYGHFQLAKMEAIKRNENVLIVFNPAGNGRYQIFVDSLPQNNANRLLDVGETIIDSVTFSPNVELVTANFGGTLTGGFTPIGRPSGGTGKVVLRSPHTEREFLLTTSIAGYVHLR